MIKKTRAHILSELAKNIRSRYRDKDIYSVIGGELVQDILEALIYKIIELELKIQELDIRGKNPEWIAPAPRENRMGLIKG